MKDKTLEHRLLSAKKTIEGILDKKELEENEYYTKMHDILVYQGMIGKNRTQENVDLSMYISGRLLLNRSIKSLRGLRNDYVVLAKKAIRSPEAEQDISDYDMVKASAKRYIAQDIDPTQITELQFRNKVFNYIIKLPQVQDLDSERKLKICIHTINDIASRCGHRFKPQQESKEGVTGQKYTIEQVSQAFDKI